MRKLRLMTLGADRKIRGRELFVGPSLISSCPRDFMFWIGHVGTLLGVGRC